MNITFITPKLNFRTAGGSIFDIDLKARALQELGANVRMVTAYSDNNDIPFKLTYPLHEERVTGKRQLSISRDAFHLLKKYEEGTDFFHIDGHIFLYGGGWYKRRGGTTPIAAFFNRELIAFPQDVPRYDFGQADPFMPRRTLLRRTKQAARRVIESRLGMPIASELDIAIFTSPVLQKTYHDFGLRVQRELLSPDLAGGVITKKEVTDKPSHADGITRFVCAGRLIPTKGFDLLLRGLSLMKHRENIHLTIAGGGPDEARLKDLARQWNVADAVTFTGWLEHDKLFPLFERSDVFIIPRWRFELTSVVMMEAMSFGLPCVVPAKGALDWQVGNAAVPFTYDDPASLGTALDTIASSEALQKKLSQNALTRIDEMHYSHYVTPLYREMQAVIHSSERKK